MNAVIKHGADEIGVAKLGEIFAQSGYFRDVRDQAQAVVKILYGRELGFSPVVSMMGIHVIEGKPSLSSNLLGTLVKRSGKYDYRVKVSTDADCQLEFFQEKESLGVASFNIDDAKRANLLKPNSGWAKYPKAMLFARALSAGVRLHCPDVSACPLYVPEELGATVDEEGTVTELPRSAQLVAVTTEDIVIEKPVAGNSASGDNVTLVKDKSPQAAGEKHTEPSFYISVGQQANLAKSFREALRPELQKDAETLRHDWLAFERFVDKDGKPSSTMIPASGWLKIRDKAIDHARSL